MDQKVDLYNKWSPGVLIPIIFSYYMAISKFTPILGKEQSKEIIKLLNAYGMCNTLGPLSNYLYKNSVFNLVLLHAKTQAHNNA